MPAAAMQSAVRKMIEDEWCAQRASGALFKGPASVDALDTLILARLEPHAAETREAISRMTHEPRVSSYALVSRSIGGMVGAHALKSDTELLRIAASIADAASTMFDSPSGIPYQVVDLEQRRGWAPASYALVSETGAVRMEFDSLSHAMGSGGQYAPPANTQRTLIGECVDGLIPSTLVRFDSGRAGGNSVVTIGTGTDHFYEQLLSGWIQSGFQDQSLLVAHQNFVHGVTTQLLRRSTEEGLLYVTSLRDQIDLEEMEHAACYYPGLLALADLHGVETRAEHVIEEEEALERLGVQDQLDVAERLMHTCIQMGDRTATGMAPERVLFGRTQNATILHGDMRIPAGYEAGNLRPEVAESLMYMYAVTRKAEYRAAGWDMWRAIQRQERAPVLHVHEARIRRKDAAGSWFISATLKYLYLLFGDGTLDLKKIVFNSAGHAFPIRSTQRGEL